MKLWSDPRINSQTLVPIRGFEAQKSEAALRTCVYSRYANAKTLLITWFDMDHMASGLAVDCRMKHK